MFAARPGVSSWNNRTAIDGHPLPGLVSGGKVAQSSARRWRRQQAEEVVAVPSRLRPDLPYWVKEWIRATMDAPASVLLRLPSIATRVSPRATPAHRCR